MHTIALGGNDLRQKGIVCIVSNYVVRKEVTNKTVVRQGYTAIMIS